MNNARYVDRITLPCGSVLKFSDAPRSFVINVSQVVPTCIRNGTCPRLGRRSLSFLFPPEIILCPVSFLLDSTHHDEQQISSTRGYRI